LVTLFRSVSAKDNVIGQTLSAAIDIKAIYHEIKGKLLFIAV
jgi:hypothetical protein